MNLEVEREVVRITKVGGDQVPVMCIANECSKCIFSLACDYGSIWTFTVGTECDIQPGDIIF